MFKLLKLTILAVGCFFVAGCDSTTVEDEYSEVYFEINTKSASGNSDNYISAELWRLESDGTTTFVDLYIDGNEAPIVKQSNTITWKKGKTIRLELRSFDWGGSPSNHVWWSETDVKVYCNSILIFEKTFNVGDSGYSTDNYFKMEVE